MTTKDRKKKKKPAKVWYSKYKGYQFVSTTLKDSKAQLLACADLLAQVAQIDRSDLLVGEIKSIEEVDTVVRQAIPSIVSDYDKIRKDLLSFIEVKRPLEDYEFKPLVDETLQFINKLSEEVIDKIARVDSVIEKALDRKNRKEER